MKSHPAKKVYAFQKTQHHMKRPERNICLDPIRTLHAGLQRTPQTQQQENKQSK